jgi:uncharacterized membrane protein
MRKIAHHPVVVGAGLLVLTFGVVSAGSATAATSSRAATTSRAATNPSVHEMLIDPGSTDSYAEAINNRGDVVGTDDSGAFLRDASGVHVLAPPTGVEAILPTAINDRGDILAQTFFEPSQVYLWRGGRWTFIADGTAAGLNGRGQVLVQVGTAAASFLLWQNGHSTAIKAPDVTGVPSLTGGYLNQAGQVAFSSRDSDAPNPIEGWLWTAGRYTRLPALVRGASAQVESLNDLGEVAGESGDAVNPTEHVAVTWLNGAVHRLATPPDTSNLNDDAAAVNDRGQVVGTNDTPDTGPEQAVLWASASAPATLLAPSYYSGARTINDAGQVLINALVATGLTGHNEALAARDGELADLGAGTPIGQNERGQIIVNTDTDPSGPVQAALFTIDWGT